MKDNTICRLCAKQYSITMKNKENMYIFIFFTVFFLKKIRKNDVKIYKNARSFFIFKDNWMLLCAQTRNIITLYLQFTELKYLRNWPNADCPFIGRKYADSKSKGRNGEIKGPGYTLKHKIFEIFKKLGCKSWSDL